MAVTKTFTNVQFTRFEVSYTDNSSSVRVWFSTGSRVFSCLAHPALCWKDRLNKPCDIQILVTEDAEGKTVWKLRNPMPTAEEEAKYAEILEKRQSYRKVEDIVATEEDLRLCSMF